jgi:hypothetical protein
MQSALRHTEVAYSLIEPLQGIRYIMAAAGERNS